MSTRILIPSGVLGLGFDSIALETGVQRKPDAICIDGGSTDSGPYYLGTGTSKYSETVSRSEWRELMQARAEANVPLIIGSCGTCGTDSAVDWMYELTLAVAKELKHSVKIARLYSSQKPDTVASSFDAGRVHSLNPPIDLTSDDLNKCNNIVALAGIEQIRAAIETGADIILAGRTTDTALIAALPIMQGALKGAAWHGAKIGECGALCTTNPTSGVIEIEFDDTGFTVEPMSESATCTPYSVSAHMLYENANPLQLTEPGGVLDVSNAIYKSLDERRVRVTGSEWHPSTMYTVKLEGASSAGFQTTILALLREPHYVRHAAEWCQKLENFVNDLVKSRMNLSENEYSIEFRLIGVDSTLGHLEYLKSLPSEVGVLGIVTANDQPTATEIARLINPHLLHFPLTTYESLPTFAFPYSPAETERGEIYSFVLNHVLELDDPMEAFRLQINEVRNGQVI